MGSGELIESYVLALKTAWVSARRLSCYSKICYIIACVSVRRIRKANVLEEQTRLSILGAGNIGMSIANGLIQSERFARNFEGRSGLCVFGSERTTVCR